MDSFNIIVECCNEVLTLLIKQYENKIIDFNTFEKHTRTKVQFMQENLSHINHEQRKSYDEILHKLKNMH